MAENALEIAFGRITVSLEGKVALITGAGSGFGEGMAKRFADGGAKVVIVDRDKAGAERVAGEIGDAALAVAADISKESDVDAAVEVALSKFGKVDILINNAGIGHKPQNAELVEPEEFAPSFGVGHRHGKVHHEPRHNSCHEHLDERCPALVADGQH